MDLWYTYLYILFELKLYLRSKIWYTLNITSIDNLLINKCSSNPVRQHRPCSNEGALKVREHISYNGDTDVIYSHRLGGGSDGRAETTSVVANHGCELGVPETNGVGAGNKRIID